MIEILKEITIKNLMERLQYDEELAKLICKGKNKLGKPIEKNGILGFDAEDLHTNKLERTNRFRYWITAYIDDYGFVEGKDFWIGFKNAKNMAKSNCDCCEKSRGKQNAKNLAKLNPRKSGRKTKTYFLTINMAKQICMIEKTPEGREYREYYIQLEDTIIAMLDWINKRYPQIPVTKRIRAILFSKYLRTFKVRPINNYNWTTNADMINLIAFGFIAKEINDYLDRPNDGKTREHLRTDCLERLTFLLEQHEILLKRGFDFDTRERELVEIYEAKYGNELNPFNGNVYPISYERPYWWHMENVV